MSKSIESKTGGDSSHQVRLRRLDLSYNQIFKEDFCVLYQTLTESPTTSVCRWLGELDQSQPAFRYRLQAQGCQLYDLPLVERGWSRVRDFDNYTRYPSIALLSEDRFGLPPAAELSYEVLDVTTSRWKCFIVPGYGLAWAPPDFALESSAASPSSLVGPREPTVVGLRMGKTFSGNLTSSVIGALVELVGAALESLTLRETYWMVDHRLNGCSRLQHLNLGGEPLDNWEPLFQAWEGPLRHSLRSLNLRATKFNFTSVERLAGILTSKPLPVLEELQLGLGYTHYGANNVEHFASALDVNKQLRILELPAPDAKSDNSYRDQCSMLEDKFQCELLGTTATLKNCQDAFFSAVPARYQTDVTDLVIFSFAAVERRRSIVWWKED